jgi:hypothetical protein
MDARCPHCDSIFAAPRLGVQPCPRCGKDVNVAHVTGLPVAPLDGSPPPGTPQSVGPPPPGAYARGPTPWEARAEYGVFKGLWLTWKEIMLRPDAFWTRVRPDGPWLDALAFAVILGVLGYVLGLLLTGVGLSQQQDISHLPGWIPDDEKFSQARTMIEERLRQGPSLGGIIVTALFLPLGLFLWAGLLHLIAMLYNATRHDFWATFRVVCYASAPNVFSSVRLLWLLAWLYTMVQLFLGILRVQETTPGKAGLTLVTPSVFVCCCCCSGPLLMGLAAMTGLLSSGLSQ